MVYTGNLQKRSFQEIWRVFRSAANRISSCYGYFLFLLIYFRFMECKIIFFLKSILFPNFLGQQSQSILNNQKDIFNFLHLTKNSLIFSFHFNSIPLNNEKNQNSMDPFNFIMSHLSSDIEQFIRLQHQIESQQGQLHINLLNQYWPIHDNLFHKFFTAPVWLSQK